ncbi:MAG: hypothetical protein VB071_15180 [Lawsonibacter sp.]|nr:hypothetical protein [Lawsonibacter sp.]
MNCAIVKDNIIVNVIVVDGDPSEFGAVPLPEGKGIGDRFDDIPTPQEDTDAMMVDHEYRLTLMEFGVNGGV